MPISPTAEGFRAAFRRPSFVLAEITWRWVIGATAAAVFLFGLFEYLRTLPVNGGELLFLRSRQPYLIGQAIAHILRGSLGRAAMTALLAAMLIALLWMVAGSVGRIATVRVLVEYFRNAAANLTSAGAGNDRPHESPSVPAGSSVHTLFRLNFLRISVAMAAAVGFLGAAILAGFVSTAAHPRPGLAFLLFLPLAALVCLAWCSLNWLLSLAAMFAVRDGADTIGAISAAVTFCRERTGAVLAVSTWTGLAHLVAFVAAMTAVSLPLGLAAVLPGRVVLLGMFALTVAYFAVVDWLYTARLAGYVCIAETPEALLKPPPIPPPPPAGPQATPMLPDQTTPAQATIDRDELILSDVPGPPAETQ